MKRAIWIACVSMLFFVSATTVCFAAGSIQASINSLNTLITGVVKGVGGICIILGILQFGISVKSHDAAQRSTGLLAIAGGLVIFFAPEILAEIS